MSETNRRVLISAAIILLVICLCLSMFLLVVAGALALGWL